MMPFLYTVPHTVTDGFGNFWECSKGRPEAGCHMEVLRPGKVQCVLCDAHEDYPPAASSEGKE